MPVLTINAPRVLETLRRWIMTPGKVVGSMALLSVTVPSHRAVAHGCEQTFCRCVPASVLGLSAEQLIDRQRERASRVVLGRVVRIDTLAPRMLGHGPDQIANHPLAARVAVSRVWKGLPTDTLTVVFGSIEVESSCDLALEMGKSYVIFALRDEEGVLGTGQCTGTAAESDAATTIAALGPGQEPKQ